MKGSKGSFVFVCRQLSLRDYEATYLNVKALASWSKLIAKALKQQHDCNVGNGQFIG